MQLCLDMIGYHGSVDGIYGTQSKQWVSQTMSNSKYLTQLADIDFFKQVKRMLMTTGIWSVYNVFVQKDNTRVVSQRNVMSAEQWPETTQQQKVSTWFDEILWETPYAGIKSDFILFVDISALKYGLKVDEHHIKRMLHLIIKENGTFSKSRTNYTPIGQVGKFAWIDAFRKWLWWRNVPAWSKTSIVNQLLATYGYMKLAGIFDARSETDLGQAYAKYNLWLYHTALSLSKRVQLFGGQASEMKQYAHTKMRLDGRKSLLYSDITYASFAYYAPSIDKSNREALA